MPRRKDPTVPPRKPGRKAKVTPALVSLVVELLAQGTHKCDIKRQIMQRLRGLSARTCENVITRAKAQLIESIGVSAEEMRAGALEVYQQVLRSEFASTREKILAQDSIVKMLGLAAPLKIQHSGHDGGPIEFDPMKLSIDQLEQLEAIIKAGGTKAADAGQSGSATDSDSEGDEESP